MNGQRIVNDHSFECKELVGMSIERFLGFYEGSLPDGVNMVILKLKEKELTQRFFLSVGLGFWEEWPWKRAVEDFEDLKEIDIGTKYHVLGKQITSIHCYGSYEKYSSIVFQIEDLKLHYRFVDENDIDSDTVIQPL